MQIVDSHSQQYSSLAAAFGRLQPVDAELFGRLLSVRADAQSGLIQEITRQGPLYSQKQPLS